MTSLRKSSGRVYCRCYPHRNRRGAGKGPSHRGERDPLNPAHRSTVAGSARRRRGVLEDRRQSLLPLDHLRTWQKVLDALQKDANEEGKIDWSKHFVDGSSIRAHQHAAGPSGSRQEDAALGTSRGGFTSKSHPKAEGFGKPLS